jgi:hypothetical protein
MGDFAMRSLRVWQWLALVKQLTSALRELVLLLLAVRELVRLL